VLALLKAIDVSNIDRVMEINLRRSVSPAAAWAIGWRFYFARHRDGSWPRWHPLSSCSVASAEHFDSPFLESKAVAELQQEGC
jgi:hypothetical protein